MRANDENIFIGKWRVVSLYANVVEQGWTLFKRYGRKSFVWEFCEIGSVRFPIGSVMHSGVLRELRRKHEPETTEYTYCAADRLLYIDRSDYEPDGFVNICINDRYRVEHSWGRILAVRPRRCGKRAGRLQVQDEDKKVLRLIIHLSKRTAKRRLRDHPTPEINSYIINGRYKKLFDKTLLPEIKKRRIGVDEFHLQMSQQQIYGEEAEKFVYEFEQKRLNHKCTIDWIAQYVANEGYDIVSYDKETDIEYNRFIEVKSYDGCTPYFYWSKNEFQVAKHRQDNYWVYLVNRTEMNLPDYSPIMIQNPYKEIIEKEAWNKEIDKYRISAFV